MRTTAVLPIARSGHRDGRLSRISLTNAMIAIGVSHVLIVARLTRGRVRSVKREEHS